MIIFQMEINNITKICYERKRNGQRNDVVYYHPPFIPGWRMVINIRERRLLMTQEEFQTRLDMMCFFIRQYKKHKQESDKRRAMKQAGLIYNAIGNIINSLHNH